MFCTCWIKFGVLGRTKNYVGILNSHPKYKRELKAGGAEAGPPTPFLGSRPCAFFLPSEHRVQGIVQADRVEPEGPQAA